MVALVLFLILAALCILRHLINYSRRPNNFPPGPFWWPIVENFLEVKKFSIMLGGVHLAFLKISEQFKTNVLGLRLGGQYVIAVSSYPLVRTVLTTDAFEGKPNTFFMRTRCMGALRGIVCTDGLLWVEQRNFVVRQLRNTGYGKKSMEFLINEELGDVMQVLKKEGPNVDFDEIFSPVILNIVWTILTGKRTCKEDPRLQNLLSLLAVRSKAFDQAGGTMNQFPWLRYITPGKINYSLVLKLNEKMRDFFMDTIKYHHDTYELGKQDNLIYSYITKMNSEKKQETFTNDQLIIIFLDLFLGAAQTSGPTISFIMLMMLLHPEIQEKAFKKINESLDLDKPLFYADRIKIPYIEAIILEVSRIYPVSALAAPRCTVKDTVLDGYDIPKGTTVYASIYSVHHDVEYWGDPEVFRPERFLDEKGNVQTSERHMLFGLGKRRCLGELLARQSLFIFFVGILRKYQICPVPNTALPSTKPANGILLNPEKYKAHLVPRLRNN